MSDNVKTYGLLAIKILLSIAFVAAGLAKLAGQEMMVQVFDDVGLGQWFRYLTGVIEVGGAALLWSKGRQFFGAALLLCTMIGAVLAHIFILGPSAVPAISLAALAGIVAFSYRSQLEI